MSRTVQILTIALLIQVVLAIGLFSRGDDKGALSGGDKMLGLELAGLDQITLQEQEGEAVVMKKQGDSWVLSSFYDFPVSQDKLKQVTDSLFDLTKGWPVATTKVAMKRFRVSKEAYERKLLFSKSGEVIKTLYMGSSPGFKQVHARVADDDNIYLIGFSLFQASMKPADWQNKNVLKHQKETLVKLTTADFSLERKGDGVVVNGLLDSEETSQKEAEDYFSRIADLTFLTVLGTDNKAAYGQDQPELSIKTILKSGEAREYRFSKMGEGSDYVLKLSSLPYYFKLSEHSVGDLKMKRERFVKLKKTEEKVISNE